MRCGNKSWHNLAASCLVLVLLVTMLFATVAYAENTASTASAQQADQLVQDIEQATATYQDATAAVDNLADQIAQNESHASEIEQALPAQREVAAKSIKQLYLFQQSSPGILELLFSADDFNEFITALEYLNTIHDHNTTQVTTLQGMYDDLAQTQAALTMELDAAKQKQNEALSALDTIRTSLNTLQQQTAAAEAEATSNTASDTQQQATSSALQEAQKIVSTLPEPVAQAVSIPSEPEAQVQESKSDENKSEENKTEDNKPAENKETGQKPTESESEAPAEEKPAEQKPAESEPQTPAEQTPAPAEPEVPVVETPPASQEQPSSNPEVDSWAARIDAYLASYGAPLAGHGATFAQAAAEYGVDPRISPAISVIESGGGRVCFRPHNAWGWGTASWGDWDSAIRGHISGFASIYGSTLTREGAEAYASMDTWETWYSLLQAEMASI